MLTLKETKDFLRIDGDEEDALIASLIKTSLILVNDILRTELSEDDDFPEPINQAILMLIATLYEERQVAKTTKSGISMTETLDMVRRMLFAYRKEKF